MHHLLNRLGLRSPIHLADLDSTGVESEEMVCGVRENGDVYEDEEELDAGAGLVWACFRLGMVMKEDMVGWKL